MRNTDPDAADMSQIDDLLQRIPRGSGSLPANVQAEQAVLGALFANPERVFPLVAHIRADWFAEPAHQIIYGAIVKLASNGRHHDAVAIKTALEASGQLEAVGGLAYLASLATAMVGLNVVPSYAATIQETALRRETIIAGAGLIADAIQPGEDGTVETVTADAVDRLVAISSDASVGRAAGDTLADAIDAALDKPADPAQRIPGLFTGLATVDAAWRGLWPGKLDILAARMGHGKTALATQIAKHNAEQMLAAAQQFGRPSDYVAIWSLEMSKGDIAERMLATETGVPVDAIRNDDMTTAQAEAVLMARKALRALPIIINDRDGMTMADLRTDITIKVRRRRVKLVIIDHLHRIEANRGSKADEISRVPAATRALKDLSRRLNVPILLLAQLNRGLERRDDPRPRASDIAYGGEADADNIILLWREELHMMGGPPELPTRIAAEKKAEASAAWYARRDAARGKAELIFAKRRFGAVGQVRLAFDGPRTLFRDLDPDDDPPMPIPDLAAMWSDPGDPGHPGMGWSQP